MIIAFNEQIAKIKDYRDASRKNDMHMTADNCDFLIKELLRRRFFAMLRDESVEYRDVRNAKGEWINYRNGF